MEEQLISFETAKFKKGDILVNQYKEAMEVYEIKVLDMSKYFLIQYIGYKLTKKLVHRKDNSITFLTENNVCESIIDNEKTMYWDNINRRRDNRWNACVTEMGSDF